MEPSERVMRRKYAAVRTPILSGLPIEGGFAGYLREGTRVTETNPRPATQRASARGLEKLKRPCAKAKISPKIPPSAVLYSSVPVSRPRPFWILRRTNSGSSASPLAALCADSNAIARSTCGSPSPHADPKRIKPAIKPASIPRRRWERVIGELSDRESPADGVRRGGTREQHAPESGRRHPAPPRQSRGSAA